LEKNVHVASSDLLCYTKQYSPKFTVHEIKNITEESSQLQHQALHLVGITKETFWIGHSDQPRCRFEELAKIIGGYHMQHQYENTACYEELLTITGYEWWIQVKPLKEQQDQESSSRGVLGVDLHYDKDEEMAENFEVGIFPTISTVTYITNSAQYCHPTVVYDCLASTPVGTAIKDCFISVPEVGKHIAFDGRLLHGAPSELIPFVRTNKSTSADDELRITFLVNIWIGHRPSAVSPMTQIWVDSLNKANTSWTDLSSGSSKKVDLQLQSLNGYQGTSVKVKEQDAQRDDLGDWITIPFVSNKAEWGKSEDEAGLDLSMWLPHYPVEQYLDMSKGKGKKRRAPSIELTTEPSSCSQTYHFQYIGENSAARLDYEDEEGEEDFANEFEAL
jgi:hypothetical protein